jgi:autotransporter-associated beta strand protein
MKTSKRRGVVFRLFLGSFVLVACCLPAVTAHAGTYYWDTNGSTAGAGDTPSGTWGTGNWSTDQAGGSTLSPHTTTSADNLYFVAGPNANSSGENAFTVTINGTQNASALYFESPGAPTLSGTGTINLGAGGITVLRYGDNNFAPQGTATVSVPVVFQAPQSWTIGSSGFGIGPVPVLNIAGNVTNGANSLTITNYGVITVSGVIGGGSGGLTQNGTGSLTLSAANTFTGATNVNGGTLTLANSAALQGSVYNGGGGALVFASNVSGHAFIFGGLTGSDNLSLQDDAGNAVALGINNSVSAVYSGTLYGTGSLTKISNNSVLTLTGTNTYSGGTTISGGTLQLGDGSSGHDGALANSGGINNNAVLAYNLYGSQTYGGVITGTGSLTKAGGGTLTLTAGCPFTGATAITGGTLQMGDGTSGDDGSLSNTSSISNNAALVYNLAGPQSYFGNISGSGSLTKVGSGTLTLSGSNSYSGGTTINGGALAVTNTGALPGYGNSGKITVGNGGTLAVSVGTLAWAASDVSTLLANNGNRFASGSALGIDTTDATSGFTYGSAVTQNMGLTKLGPNTLTLSATNNTYSGNTTVNLGTLAVTNTGALPGYGTSSRVAVSSGAMLTVSAGSSWTAANINSLASVNGNGFASGSFLGIDTTSASFTYTNTIGGSMGMAKVGSNTLVLTAANTYTGPTTISGGTLQLGDGTSGHDGSLASASINDNAVLAYNLNGSQTCSGVVNGTGSLTKAGSGVLTLTGSNTFQGATTISGGTLQLGDGTSGHDGSLSGGIINNTAMVYNLNGSQNYAGTISGSGSLTKTGTGSLILSGINTYSGRTTVSGGAIAVTSTGALPGYGTSSKITVGSGAMLTLSVGGAGWTHSNVSSLIGANGTGFASSSVLGMDTTGATSGFYYGIGDNALTGSMGLTVVGPNALILTASNTYTGGTTITAGVLQLGDGTGGHDGSISGPITDNSWLIYNLAGSQTCSSVISGSGCLQKAGSGTLTLTAANTFGSSTWISGGTLLVANANALQSSNYCGISPGYTGSLVFSSSVTSHAFTFGGLVTPYGTSAWDTIVLQDNAGNPVALSTNLNFSSAYAGTLNGPGSLTKVGSNSVLTLTGSNSYTGGTTISGGTLQLGNGTTGNDGSLSNSGGVNNNGMLLYNLCGSQTYSGVISGSGNLTKIGVGTLILTGASSLSGTTTIAGGVLQLGDGSSGRDGSLSNTSGINDYAALVYSLSGSQTYSGPINGTGSLTKAGGGVLTLSGSTSFSGPTTISGGTLDLANANALLGSTVAAPTTGSIVFDQNAGSTAFSFGGLSGAGNINLSTNAAAAVVLTVGYNNASTTYSGALSGSGSLVKTGNGVLTLAGSDVCNGGVTVNGGGLSLASTASLTTATGGSLWVGNSSSGAMTIADSALVSVGELDVNYQNTGGNPSTLTLTGGSLHVSGQAVVGRAQTTGVPTTTSAALYQSGGTATVAGRTVVGYNGTATSLYDISGGVLNAGGGLYVGGNPSFGPGNGVLNIHGSGVVNVSGGSGLVIGQDATGTTGGSLTLSSGTLAVVGNMTLGGNNGSGGIGGISTLVRNGGTMTVSGSLVVNGFATLILDDTTGSVATLFGKTLTQSGLGTLVVVPQNGDLGGGESLSFASSPALTDGILGPFAVRQASGSDTSGDYLTTTGSSTFSLATATYHNGFAGATWMTVVSATGTSSLNQDTSVYAVKLSNSTTTTLGSGNTLTINSGGMILNGGTLAGGTTDFPHGVHPMIYAGSSNMATISSSLLSDSELVKFGSGNLVLSGSNSGLTGGVIVSAGTLCVQNSGALGMGGTNSSTVVAAGACLQLQGNIAVGNVPIVINGLGALQNVQGNNSLGGTLSVASNSQINTITGTLTLVSSIVDPNSYYTLTKTGSGTLALTADSTSLLTGPVVVAGGTLLVENSGALGGAASAAGTTIQNGATLSIQGGLSLAGVPLTLNGSGLGNHGALESVSGNNSLPGPISLGSDSQVNIDAAADTLTLAGPIGGGFALTKAGSGTLVLSGSNTFSGGLSVQGGTLSVASLNAAGSAGPLGAGTAPVVLGSSGNAATFLYTGGSTTNNRAFTMAAGGGGVFPVANSLELSGAIDGNGGLTKTGSGTLTLSGPGSYTGPTTIGSGTLAVSSSGSLSGTSAVVVSLGCLLQVTAGSGNQLPDVGNITISGGSVSYVGNGSASTGELVGALLLNPGQSSLATSSSGSGGSPYLRFASGAPSATIGATINFTSSNCPIQFQSNPPGGNGSIIGGYAFYNNADFAALTATNSAFTVGALASYTTGDLGPLASNGTTNAKPSGSQSSFSTAKEINSLNLSGTAGVTMTGGTLTLDSGGLIGNTSGAIGGGTLKGSANGELTINTVQSLTIGSVLANNGGPTALVKAGSGNLTLTGNNTYSGDTYLNQGTLVYNLSNNLSYGGTISGIGGLTKSGSAALTLTGTNVYTGPTTVSQGNLAVNGALAAASAVTVQNTGVLSGSGTIGGNVLLSGGTINLSGGGTICGTATATGGSWQGSGTVLGSVAVSSGTITVGNSSGSGMFTTLGGLNVTGTAAIAFANPATVLTSSLNDASAASMTLSSAVSGANTSVTLNSPAAKLVLTSSNNSYGGGTFVSAGTLSTTNSSALGSGGLTIGSQGVFDLNAQNYTFPSLAGSVGGVLTDLSTTTGTTTVTVSGSGSSNYGGSISNGSSRTLSLVVSGSANVVLSGTNTYTGGTTVSGGTLELTSAAALSSAGNLVVSDGGRVVLDNSLAGGAPQTAALAAASSVAGDSPPGLSLLGSSQWAALAARARAAHAQLTSSIESSSPTLAAAPSQNMAALGSEPVLVSGGVGSVAVAAVPEPGTLLLMLAAVAGLGLFQVRRRIRG